MRKSRYHNLLLSLFLCAAFPCATRAQDYSFRASAGFAYLPLTKWSEFSSKISNSYYRKNNPNFYYGVSSLFAFGESNHMSITVEVLRSSASSSGASTFIVWEFQSIPISANYEYHFSRINSHFTPFVGGGASYMISRVKATERFTRFSGERRGKGFGVHAVAGLISQLSEVLGLVTQLRYRFSDGMAFTDNPNDIKVEFTGIDLSIALELSF